MSRDSNVHSVSIVAQPTTLLAQIAAAMPNRSWVYMNGGTFNGVVCTKPAGLDTFPYGWRQSQQGTFGWCNRLPWNPVAGTVEGFGWWDGLHGGEPYSVIYWNRYIVSTNSCDALPMRNDEGANHSFEQQTCNPFDGQMYLRFYGGGEMHRWTSGAFPPFTPIATNPTNSNIMAPCEWWRGSITGGGAQGLLVHVSNYGVVDFYNPLTNTWLAGTSYSGGQNYNQLSAYSLTKNVMLFGGSNFTPNDLWKVKSDRSVMKMTNAPVNVSLYQCNFIADPVTGNFLVHTKDREFYELNPDGNGGMGTWTLLSPAPNGGSLGTVNVHGTGARGCGVSCVQDIGVVLFISENASDMSMHVYKHGT